MECLLELLRLAFLLLLQIGNQLGQGGDHLSSLVMVRLVLLAWLVQGVLSQNDVELTKQVNAVSHELEAVVDSVQFALLDNEFLDVGNWTSKFSN